MRARCHVLVTLLVLCGDSPAAAQSAFWSLTGDFQNATDAVQVNFELTGNGVSSADNFRGNTLAHSGGFNAVGDLVPAGGFDPVLSLFEILGPGVETLRGQNDDGHPAPSRDALLSWPGVATGGGAIGTDPLQAGDYRLALTAYQPDYPGGTSPWAMDLIGPWLPATAAGVATTGGAVIRTMKFGGGSSGGEEAWFSIDAATTPTVTVTDEFVAGAVGTGRLFVNDGTTLITPGTANVGTLTGFTGDGHAMISGSGAVWDAGFLGIGGQGMGYVTVENHARLLTNRTNVLRGSVTVNGGGGGTPARWEVADKLFVGNSQPGTGTVHLEQGGQLTVGGSLDLASSGPGVGRLLVGTSGSVTVGDELTVGASGALEQLGGTIHTGSFVVEAGSVGPGGPGGEFIHEDGTLTIDGGTLDLGADAAEYMINGVDSTDLPVVALVRGATSLLSDNLLVGADQRGRLELSSGSRLSLVGDPFFGANLVMGSSGLGTGDGEVIVDGLNTSAVLNGSVAVGNFGNGVLRILNGGSVINELNSVLAQFGGSQGAAEVSGRASNGAQSTWTSEGTAFVVGNNGPALLTISNSGNVLVPNASGRASIAEFTGGGGSSVTVTDPESLWDIAGSLSVGGGASAGGGNGMLSVQSSGLVRVGKNLRIWPTGMVHLAEGGIYAGSLAIEQGGTFVHDDGLLYIDGGAFVPGTAGYTISGLNPGDNPGLHLINGASASFTDTVQIASTGDATLDVEGPGTVFESSGGIFDVGWIASGKLNVMNGGVVNHTGGFVFNLGVAQNASGQATVGGTGSQINTNGLMIVGDHGAASLTVYAGGSVSAERMWIAHYPDAQQSAVAVSGLQSALDINGSLYISGDDAQGSGVESYLQIESQAQVNVLDTLKVWSAGTLYLFQDGAVFADHVDLEGRLKGDGNVVVASGLTNSGAVSPGSPPGVGFSLDVITVEGSDYAQTPAGALEIKIGGTGPTEFDQLHVERGAAVLDGLLSVSLVATGGAGNVFSPSLGDVFEILSAEDGVNGTFASESLPALTGNLKLQTFYAADAVLLAAVPALAGDYNADGVVDAADYTVWRDALGASGAGLPADGNHDGQVTRLDYGVWRTGYGQTLASIVELTKEAVPTPSALALAFLCIAGATNRRLATRSVGGAW